MELSRAELPDGVPARALGRSDQLHRRFVRRPVALLHVASETGTHDVFPGGMPTTGQRDDVVQGKLRGRELVATVLAAVSVSDVDVVPRELDFLARQTVEVFQGNDSRNPDRHGRRQ